MDYELSFECFPPKTPEGLQRLGARMQSLCAFRPHFYSVTYGAGGSERHATLETLQHLHRQCNTPVTPHITALGATKKDIRHLLNSYCDAGIQKLLVLRGDLPQTPNVKTGDFLFAHELMAFIQEHDPNRFHITVAAYPECHPESACWHDELKHFKHKVDAGAHHAITQYFYNPDAYMQFMRSVRAAGISIPITPGIMPIHNLDSLIRFSKRCEAEIPRWLLKRLTSLKDQPEALHAFADDFIAQLCHRLLSEGAPGLHFYTLNQADRVASIIQRLEALGWAGSKQAPKTTHLNNIHST